MSDLNSTDSTKVRYVYISEAAKILGIAACSLRRWEREGRIVPDKTTLGGWRQYRLDVLERMCKNGLKKVNKVA